MYVLSICSRHTLSIRGPRLQQTRRQRLVSGHVRGCQGTRNCVTRNASTTMVTWNACPLLVAMATVDSCANKKALDDRTQMEGVCFDAYCVTQFHHAVTFILSRERSLAMDCGNLVPQSATRINSFATRLYCQLN